MWSQKTSRDTAANVFFAAQMTANWGIMVLVDDASTEI
uniref:Uncharacterized protein n=1 Tax=Peronospora matthiolae TaxID=2874970 RepID=A0AAV1VDG9_9STRA